MNALQRPKSTYSVTERNVAQNEPEWAVFVSGSGACTDVVAHFFSPTDAHEYAEWKNGQRKANRDRR